MNNQEISQIKDDLARLTELAYELRISQLEKAIDKLMIAGRATSNCCYNVGQFGGTVLDQRHANSLSEAAQEWDRVINEVREVK